MQWSIIVTHIKQRQTNEAEWRVMREDKGRGEERGERAREKGETESEREERDRERAQSAGSTHGAERRR